MNKIKIKKKRIDQILLEKKLVESRNKAQALIMAGNVYVNEIQVNKAGDFFKDDILIKILEKNKWVSRGALKLEPIIINQKIVVEDKICLDIGSSTGGFTEVLLKYGAKKIYAVDVGYGQLHERLRKNLKVISLEKKNARYLESIDINENIDILLCDASFISFKKVLDRPIDFLKKNGYLIGLIKPQFEAKKKEIERGGIIKDEKIHKRICSEIREWLTNYKKFKVISIIESPLMGVKGNREFFITAVKLTKSFHT